MSRAQATTPYRAFAPADWLPKMKRNHFTIPGNKKSRKLKIQEARFSAFLGYKYAFQT
jgi:hypothetical protein